MYFWAEEKYEVCQLLLLRGMIATQLLVEEDEKAEEANDEEKEQIPDRAFRYHIDPVQIRFGLK